MSGAARGLDIWSNSRAAFTAGLCALNANAKWYVACDAVNGCALHSYPDGRMLQQVGSAETHLQTISDDGKWLALTQGDVVLIFETLPEYQ